MRIDKVNKAREAYRAGDYCGALRLYHELAVDVGHKLFYANVALCLDKLKKGTSNTKAECIALASKGKYDVLADLFAQDIIVSLTSYPGRINAAPATIRSILAQSFKPAKVMLWLAYEQFPRREKDLPAQLLELKDHGLAIEWCEDIRSYKKLIPTLKKFPEKTIVTADDDILYGRDWLAQLVIMHLQCPDAITCHRAHRVTLDSGGNITSYAGWAKEIKGDKPSFNHLFTGCGGVLYPPHSLHEFALDDSAFTSICPNGDDLWFWGMAVLNETKIQIVKDSNFQLKHVPGTQDAALWKDNVLKGGNDFMLKALSDRYPEIQARVQTEKLLIETGPKVSVITPVFNTGKYLSFCLDSLLKQSFQNIEVLCVDDGSTDKLTKDVLTHYSKQDTRVRVIRQTNSGPATARNNGLRHARGAFVAFVDSDDFVSHQYVENLYKNISQHGGKIAVASQIWLVDESGARSDEKKSGLELLGQIDAKRLAAHSIVTTGVAWNKIYEKDFLSVNSIHFLDGMRCPSEDNYFSILAMVLGHNSISLAENATYYYRQHNGAITKNITWDSFDESVLVYQEVKNKLMGLNIPDNRYWINVINERALKDLRYSAKSLVWNEGIEKLLVKNFASQLEICCIADENYIIPTLVFLESVKRTKRRTTIPIVTVLAPQGARKKMEVLEELSESDFFVKVLEVDSSKFLNLHKHKGKDDFLMASPSAMFKFIIPELFKSIDRILYIDTDLIVREDLFELFMFSMENEYLCAVPDLWSPVTEREDVKRFGCYFNSGVMLMNLSLMRQDNLPEKLIETKRNTTNFNLMDQDVFNEVCDGRIKVLDIKYNFLPVCYKRHKHRFKMDMVNELYGSNYINIEEIAADPVIAHWAGSEKPWVTTETLFADEWMDMYASLKARGFLNRNDLSQWASMRVSSKEWLHTGQDNSSDGGVINTSNLTNC